jgi:hypothetical protein
MFHYEPGFVLFHYELCFVSLWAMFFYVSLWARFCSVSLWAKFWCFTMSHVFFMFHYEPGFVWFHCEPGFVQFLLKEKHVWSHDNTQQTHNKTWLIVKQQNVAHSETEQNMDHSETKHGPYWYKHEHIAYVHLFSSNFITIYFQSVILSCFFLVYAWLHCYILFHCLVLSRKNATIQCSPKLKFQTLEE